MESIQIQTTARIISESPTPLSTNQMVKTKTTGWLKKTKQIWQQKKKEKTKTTAKLEKVTCWLNKIKIMYKIYKVQSTH